MRRFTLTAAGVSFDKYSGFALVFGIFLGIALVKLGNPVVLESRISPPTSLFELWSYIWPPSWGFWMLLPLVVAGAALALPGKRVWPGSRLLWFLPCSWFVWQLFSGLNSEDVSLTNAALWQLGGCLACYFLGAFVLGQPRRFEWLLVGLLLSYAFCLSRAADQKLFEFPQERQFLLEGERTGWTNLPPQLLLDMKRDSVVIHTNGLDVANPLLLAKYEKGRVHGTLVYPNALAGAVLLLFPIALIVAITGTRRFRAATRVMATALALVLGLAVLFWTGSKSGWLIALSVWALWLFRLQWPVRLKWATLVLVLGVGLAIFGLRFHNYFAAGAASLGARFDYWKAAVQTTRQHPVLGTGPGTFQRPYQRVKPPQAEMARLTHNDYLEQFSDSGVPGGLSYACWIGLLLAALGRRVWNSREPLQFAVYLGLLGWFVQGFSEFSLYVPALAWTAFTLSGCLLAWTGNEIDKSLPNR